MAQPDNKNDIQNLEHLIQQARRNEAIALKLFEIELSMLKASELSEFTDRLTEQVRDRFQLDDAWFAFIDIEENRRIMALMSDQGALSERLLCPSGELKALTATNHSPILSSTMGHLQKLTPGHLRDTIKSTALLPLEMENRIIGALILGSSDPQRYTADMASFFLEQLAVKTSAGLTSIWAREQLRQLATRDPLTGLRNRRDMEAALEQELGRSKRYGLPMALMFFDLDDFKQINDNWGHETGDACLVHVSQRLESFLRRDDSLFRFAGDEFVALLPGQSEASAEQIAQRMQEALSSTPLHTQNAAIVISFSYGVACIKPEDNVKPDELIRTADQRLYEMKRNPDRANTAQNSSL